MRGSRVPWLVGLLAVAATACAITRPLHLRSNALDYLYPQGKTVSPARDVTLRLPARVGLAFAPGPAMLVANDPFSASQKNALLTRMAEAFREREYVGSVEIMPTSYLSAGGGFDELDRLAASFGIDLMALVSYDQRQFTETTNSSWTYLTVVGAFAIRGEKNETRTVMDTVVYDIPSRALLFRASGESTVHDRSTPVKIDRKLRLDSESGFELATTDLIANLETALETFRDQASSGTVRGVGTPELQIVRNVQPGEGGAGAGAFGPFELIAALALGGLLVGSRRR